MTKKTKQQKNGGLIKHMVNKKTKTYTKITKTQTKQTKTNLIYGTKSNQTLTIKMHQNQKTTKIQQQQKPITQKKTKRKPKIKQPQKNTQQKQTTNNKCSSMNQS